MSGALKRHPIPDEKLTKKKDRLGHWYADGHRWESSNPQL